MQPDPPETPNQKLDRMIALLEKIERHLAPPPLWQRTISFGFNHLSLILSLFFLAYVTYKIWGSLRAVSENVDSIQTIMNSFVGGVKSGVGSLKFWGE